MARAVWRGVVIAGSDETVIVEGNHYFPPDAINRSYLDQSDRRTVCPWKGTASYYDIVANGRRNKSAAWYYPAPSSAAAQITDHVAFWKGVTIEA